METLASRLIREASERGWQALTPEEPERRGPLVVLSCADATRVVETLAEHDIVVSARGSGLRVSFHYYNVADDIEALVSVLDKHAGLMARTSA